MSTAQPIANHVIEFRRQGRQVFLKAHPDPILLVRIPEPSGSGDWTSFQTHTYDLDRPRLAAWSEEELAAAEKAEGLHVVEVAKSADSPWRGRISLGRARNNDLTVVHASVSKLHAHFNIAEDGSLTLTDAGSHNGTKINDRTLEPNKPVPVTTGDKIAFGEISAVLQSPETFCDFLAGLFDKV